MKCFIRVLSQATKHHRLNRASRPCEESKDYSLADCINQAMAQQIGCQSFWSNFSGIPICQNWTSLKNYIMSYEQLTYLNGHFDKHGCLDPCIYTEYQVRKNIKTL